MATAQQPAASIVTLRVERRFAAPPERLFAAWSTAEGLNRWSAPGEARPTAEVDLRVGGRYRIVMEAPDGARHVVGGVYREIDPPRRLVYTWQWESIPGFPETRVTVEFSARADGGTDLVLVHEGLPDEGSRERHAHGWDGCFAKLAAAT
jgi:uncharacterized protein YndB with AHSA1/START domain